MSNEYSNWFDQMEQDGIHLNPEQRKKVEDRLNSIISYRPRIGVFGKTGVGKSSLCNALFGQDICEISDVAACTREPKEIFLNMGRDGLGLVDVPGVGESEDRDEEYANLYANLLPELDLVLWLVKADDRAMASDEMFYKNIVKPHIDQNKPFFFVVNQVDKIEPFREWDESKHEPGPKQFQNIHRKVDAIADQFAVQSSIVIPVSANEKYNLTKLVDEIVFALPKEKNITLFKSVNEEFKSKAAAEHVKKSALEVICETVSETIVNVVDKTGEIIVTVADKAIDFGKKVMDFIDRHPLPFPRWPF